MLDLDDNSSAPDKQVSSPTNLYSEKENSGKGTRPVSKRTKVYCEVSDDLVSNIGRNKIAGKKLTVLEVNMVYYENLNQ